MLVLGSPNMTHCTSLYQNIIPNMGSDKHDMPTVVAKGDLNAAGVRAMALSLPHNTRTLWLPGPAGLVVDGNMWGADGLRYQTNIG